MFEHYSVLRTETIEGMEIKPTGTYVDCTVGGGGHSEQIASRLSENGLLIAFDQDLDALQAAKERLAEYKDRILFVHSNFSRLEEALEEHQIDQVDGILFDLGVSSPQLDRGERGFSYQHDAILDMRMDQTKDLNAYEIVNNWSYNDLVKIFFKYGEEKFAKQIARKIEAYRKTKTIDTTHELVGIIKEGIPAPARRKGGHPAKRIFQALRIAVNDELGVFNDALHQAARVVGISGRIAVITFHSLEDRLCKQAFKKWSTPKATPRNLPILPEANEAPFRLVNRKPIIANEHELEVNRRSRSAKLRIIEKISDWKPHFRYEEGWRK
ncbi:16S rRNA (cytosine(1402)-N(4))-methyltransferase RsmH [Virgibacillus sp. AGTR]|uniref:Ribosomal RNA small subunit methyltransferase H n=1 Tax=Virgibacillus salarius TaxID=447199 RepID=A0A941DTR5_9BACI|nr:MULTISPECIES: 16S rRNA (cytosine(1402)-N(4))-methyltransferase RsmH [Bacillaceae]MBR7795337.1 16S rRNA (cytosine(1402)-N(4))-methyltransferase RsmH [Virgibacillus salarius]MCC2249611.1 16S rRNA (cytosine(1402)-N(4))-methyltransferase RsmH [Virgibacillus sp. AGTR]MDY7044191.1 16S rRNA (cytosine(1402)-N(4))-methyltransferase RsmH [Virgibacillus sp. M23]QRZ20196.1 16S rRNA (cytosine(1402)-N(4))-methyltransferase RsmH [Virgibacillus sp. AGTR]WBX79656.1 16S rRNA (cytosine(1402)-N(4))-methyltrans